MVSGVEEVRLGMDVTLDMEMLAQYDGKGECRRVGVWVDGGSAAPREEAAAEGGRDPPPPNTDELRRKRKVRHLILLGYFSEHVPAPDDGLGRGGRLGHAG